LVEVTITKAEYREGRFGPEINIQTDGGFLPRSVYEFRKVPKTGDPKDARSIAFQNAVTARFLQAVGHSKANVEKLTAGNGLLVLDLKNPVDKDGLAGRQADDVIIDLVGRKFWAINADPDLTGTKYGKLVVWGTKGELTKRFDAAGGATDPVGAVVRIAAGEEVALQKAAKTPANRRGAAPEEAPTTPVAGATGGDAPAY
jgi:hypothetical protein